MECKEKNINKFKVSYGLKLLALILASNTLTNAKTLKPSMMMLKSNFKPLILNKNQINSKKINNKTLEMWKKYKSSKDNISFYNFSLNSKNQNRTFKNLDINTNLYHTPKSNNNTEKKIKNKVNSFLKPENNKIIATKNLKSTNSKKFESENDRTLDFLDFLDFNYDEELTKISKNKVVKKRRYEDESFNNNFDEISNELVNIKNYNDSLYDDIKFNFNNNSNEISDDLVNIKNNDDSLYDDIKFNYNNNYNEISDDLVNIKNNDDSLSNIQFNYNNNSNKKTGTVKPAKASISYEEFRKTVNLINDLSKKFEKNSKIIANLFTKISRYMKSI